MRTTSFFKPQRNEQQRPFGMLLTGRNWESGGQYRYGFNGQEQDDEVYENGNLNTAEFWGYDTRLGRRWNLDIVLKPWETPYSTFGDNPILYQDLKGNSPSSKADKWIAKHNLKPGQYTRDEYDNVIWIIYGNKGGVSAKKFENGFIEKAGNKIKHTVVEVSKSGAALFMGVANGWASDNALGFYRRDPYTDFGEKYGNWAYVGQKIGDAAATVTGIIETIAGTGGEVIGVTLDATGVGAIPGVPIGVVSSGVTAHGIATTANAIHNLFTTELPDSNGSGGGDSYKRVDSNKEANKVAQKLGYQDAEDLKETYVGSDGKYFDIYVDRSSGKVQLRTKNGETKVDVVENLND